MSRVVPTHHLPVPLTHLGNAPDSFFGIRAATAVVDDLWLAEAGLAWLWVALDGARWRQGFDFGRVGGGVACRLFVFLSCCSMRAIISSR